MTEPRLPHFEAGKQAFSAQEHRRVVSQMHRVPLTDQQKAVADSIFQQKLEENRERG